MKKLKTFFFSFEILKNACQRTNVSPDWICAIFVSFSFIYPLIDRSRALWKKCFKGLKARPINDRALCFFCLSRIRTFTLLLSAFELLTLISKLYCYYTVPPPEIVLFNFEIRRIGQKLLCVIWQPWLTVTLSILIPKRSTKICSVCWLMHGRPSHGTAVLHSSYIYSSMGVYFRVFVQNMHFPKTD